MRPRCVKCRRPQRKKEYVLVPPSMAAWISGERHLCRPAALCAGCAKRLNDRFPPKPGRPRVTATPSLDSIASYSPETGDIHPLPLMAIHMDHDIHRDGPLIAAVALTHEFVHRWLHRNLDYVACIQFDNVGGRFNNLLYGVLNENFPDDRRTAVAYWPERGAKP